MQLGFNLWAWAWCYIARPRKSGILGGGTGGIYGARCPGSFAFLEPKEFLEPVEPIKQMGFHRFQTFLGFKYVMVQQIPHRFHTGSTQIPQVPWVQSGQWFHRFQTESLGSATLWFHNFQTSFLGSKNMQFHRFHAFLGFKNALVPKGSRQIPWVQVRNDSIGSTQVPWDQPSIGSIESRQVPWI